MKWRALSGLSLVVLFLVLPTQLYSQLQGRYLADSLAEAVKKCRGDSNKVKALNTLGYVLWFIDPEDGIKYSQQALTLAIQIKWDPGMADAYSNLGMNYYVKLNEQNNSKALTHFKLSEKISERSGYKFGQAKALFFQAMYYSNDFDFARAIEFDQKAREIYDHIGEKREIAWVYYNLGMTHLYMGLSKQGLSFLKIAEAIASKSGHIQALAWIHNALGECYFDLNTDSSAYYTNLAIKECDTYGFILATATPLGNMGRLYLKNKDYKRAKSYIKEAIVREENNKINFNLNYNLAYLADVYYQEAVNSNKTEPGKVNPHKRKTLLDSAVYFYNRSLAENRKWEQNNVSVYTAIIGLARSTYQLKDYKRSVDYYLRASVIKDSLFSTEKHRAVSSLEAQQDIKLREKQIEILRGRSQLFQVMMGSFFGGLILLSIIVIVVMRSLKHRKQANLMLEDKNRRIEEGLKRGAAYVNSLLPERLNLPGLETDYLYIPSERLGGDAFGYHFIDKDYFSFYIFDVCGHGIGAALHSVSVIHFIHSGNHMEIDFRRPEIVVGMLNSNFQSDHNDGMFFTMWFGTLNLATRELTYVCAGHPAPAIFLANGELITVGSPGVPVGIYTSVTYQPIVCSLPEEAEIILFSDGVYEIEKPDGKMMPLEEFYHLLEESNKYSITPQLIHSQLIDIQGSSQFADDFSFMKIKLKVV